MADTKETTTVETLETIIAIETIITEVTITEVTTTEVTITEVTVTVGTTISVVAATETTTIAIHHNITRIKEAIRHKINARMTNQTKIKETTEDKEIEMTDLDGSTVTFVNNVTLQVSV